MRYYEINLTISLKENIHFTKSGNKIGTILHKLMLNDSELISLHSQKSIKNFVFSNFYPTEKDGLYKAGNNYIFKLRCANFDIAKAFKKVINENQKNHLLDFISFEMKTIKQFYISSFSSVTPTIITYKKDNYDRCWTIEDDIIALQGKLQINLIKKYELMTKEKLEMQNSFIQFFEILNKKPIKLIYETKEKGRTFLGNKFRIFPNDDINSQKLAFTALACGLGEKNSLLGAGFCLGGC
jgi:CRISPR-associated endoribonuclease Cas6